MHMSVYLAPGGAPFLLGRLPQVLAVVEYLSLRRGEKAQEQHTHGGLAAATFAGDGRDAGLALADRQGNVIQSHGRALFDKAAGVDLGDVAELQ